MIAISNGGISRLYYHRHHYRALEKDVFLLTKWNSIPLSCHVILQQSEHGTTSTQLHSTTHDPILPKHDTNQEDV